MKSSNGFTLIEVLIASVILFSSIALVAEIFSLSSLSSEKISKIQHVNQVTPLVLDRTRLEVEELGGVSAEQASLRGSFILSDVAVEWSAERIESLTPITQLEDNVIRSPKFALYQVNNNLTYKSHTQNSSFKVLAW